jgi:hypothetical protein
MRRKRKRKSESEVVVVDERGRGRFGWTEKGWGDSCSSSSRI